MWAGKRERRGARDVRSVLPAAWFAGDAIKKLFSLRDSHNRHTIASTRSPHVWVDLSARALFQVRRLPRFIRKGSPFPIAPNPSKTIKLRRLRWVRSNEFREIAELKWSNFQHAICDYVQGRVFWSICIMPICAAAETDDDLWHSAQRLRPPRKIPLVTSSIVNQPKIAAQQRNFALQARKNVILVRG